MPWSHVQTHLEELRGQPRAGVRAAMLAASDALVVREMAVIGLSPAATETAAAAAARFLALTFDGQRGCNLTDAEIRLAYMQDLGRYKHPPSWTVWDAIGVCCDKPDGCPPTETAPCRAAVEPTLRSLASTLREDFAALPALGAAAEATSVTLDRSPLRDQHLPRFEARVAAAQSADRRIQLRRYTFWQRDVAGFEKAPFRRAEAEVEQAAQRARLGEVVGPVGAREASHVFVVAARAPLSLGLPKSATATAEDPIAITLRSQLCRDAALRDRDEYRERLLGGAVLSWRRDVLARHLDAADVQTLLDLAQRK